MTHDPPKPRLAETVACAAIALLGIAALIVAFDYQIGSVQRMGPGFFPVATSVAVIGLAVASAVESRSRPAAGTAFRWRPLIFVSLAVIVWCALIDSAGLLPATFGLILVSALAKPPFRAVALTILAGAICLAGYLIFIAGLGMPISLIGS